MVRFIPQLKLWAVFMVLTKMQGYDIEDIFKPDYSRLIRKSENGQMDLFEANDSMIFYFGMKEGRILPKLMFKNEVRDSILFNDNFGLN